MARRLTVTIALVVTALALVASSATMTLTGVGSGRVAVVPLSIPLAIGIVVVVTALMVMKKRGASWLPLVLLFLPLLAWLPGPARPLLLVWTGGASLIVWLAVLVAIAATATWPAVAVRRPALTACVLAAGLYAFAAWQVAPSIPGGDEPHYLVITQSLLEDGDLKIENNHRQRDYRAYFAGDLAPDFRVRGRNREIYSIHAPGVSALVLPAFALAGYHGVVVFLIVLAAAASALAWHLAWRVTGSTRAAWFGWASVTGSATVIFHSFTVYPDGPGSVVVLTGVWALLRAHDEEKTGDERALPWLWHGAALATLPWMHQRFAALAGCLGALVLLRLGRVRNPQAKAAAFLLIPALSALAWIASFIGIYGTADPTVPFGDEVRSFQFIPGALTALLFDQRFGLLAYAPVLLFALGGLVVMLRQRAHRRLAFEFLFVSVPYLLVVSYVAMWWGGRSAPARFLMPVLLPMTIPAALAWTAMRSRTARVTALAALTFTAFASAVLISVDGGQLAYNARETYAYWLEWLNGTIDLGRALPSWWRDREGSLYLQVALWLATFAAAWGVLRRVEGQRWARTRASFVTVAAAVYAIAAMTAAALTWRLAGVDGVRTTAAQLQALRTIGSERRLLAVDAERAARVRPDGVPSMLRIDPAPASEPGGAGRNDRPLFSLPGIPAGRYRLVPRATGDGWLMVGVGRDQFSLRSEELRRPPQSLTLDFPVDVRAIVIRGDERARRNLEGVTVEPLSVVPARQRLARDFAGRAVRYAGGTTYFMDGRAFPEPEAFWVGGARRSSIVLQPDAVRPVGSLLVRNGVAENRVLIEAGSWRDEAQMGPGEERRVEVPLDTARGATLVTFTTSAGFRPSEVDAGSRDDRFLGVWVKVLGY